MANRFRMTLGKRLSSEVLSHVEAVFRGENLLQTILHAHLLIERAMTQAIVEKLARPQVLREGRYGRWSFHQKLALYVGLYNPPKEQEQMLLGFNNLRNAIAHSLEPPEASVARFLPWGGESPQPDAMTHVWVVAAILLFDLGGLQGIERLNSESHI